jgi:hypothetical protein
LFLANQLRALWPVTGLFCFGLAIRFKIVCNLIPTIRIRSGSCIFWTITNKNMKKAVFYLVLFLLGCRKESELEPDLLSGTWTVPMGDKYQRWTFDRDVLYIKTDSVSSCEPTTDIPHRYRLEKNKLIVTYAGISNGLFPIEPVSYDVESLTNRNMKLSNLYMSLNLKKCEQISR